jgi:Cu(I)/Ag(I) efflux system membrane fusion protein
MAHDPQQMTSTTLISFVGGVAVTLLVIAGWWTLSNRSLAAAGDRERSGGIADMGMDGMTMDHGATDRGQASVTLSPTRRQTIGVKTGVVERRPFETTIHAVGTVTYDERRIKQVNLRVAGWVTNLAVNYTGQFVRAGEPLLTIYSPELASTQAEYRLARRTQARVVQSMLEPIRTGADAQVQAAAERLRRLNVSDEQIEALEHAEPRPETTLVAPVSGVVTKKMALQGAYATPDMPLYEIADLSTMWVHAQVYEHDLSLVALGQEAEVTLAAYPNEAFRGRVVFIDPVLISETRTTPVRMEIPNHDLRLKPGMYGNVTIRVRAQPVLAIPREAVLDSGTRTLAFLDLGDGRFKPRDIKTGRTFGDHTEVIEGLQPGDTIVTSGTFLIDSESKLLAATNMMGALGMGGIRMEQAQMGEMEMGDMRDMKGMPPMQMRAAADMLFPQTIDGVTITLETVPAPAEKGENTVRVTVRANNAPVTDATVTVAYTMAMPGMDVETVKAGHTKDGVYEATVDLAMRGAWRIDATVTRPNAKPITAQFTVQVGK